MKTLDRRDFLKKATLAGASALAVPTLFESCTSKASASTVVVADGLESKLIVPNTIAKSKNSRPKNKMCH